MKIHRAFYWAGPLFIVSREVLVAFDGWVQSNWQSRLLERGAMERFWMGIVAASFGLLAMSALATHIAFFFKRPNARGPFALAVFLLPHLLLCALLIGTSVVLEGSGIFGQLGEMGLDFLGRFLFYVSVVWFPSVLVLSLMPTGGGAVMGSRVPHP